MKKLLIFLPVLLVTLVSSAQYKVDPIRVGTKYGNFRGYENDTKTKPAVGELTVTGTIVSTGEQNCINNKCTVNSITIKTNNSTSLIIGTKDYGFVLPGNIVGIKIIAEGIDPANRDHEKRGEDKTYQKDIQFAATGIKFVK